MLSVQLEAAALETELLQLWRRLLQNEAVTADDDFFDMGGDSLLAAELITELERRTGKSIPESLLFEASTARKVAQRLAEPAAIEAKAVVEVGPVGDGNPLLFFHGDWGDGGFYIKLFARALAPVMPLVAIAPHGLGGEDVPATLEDMALDRLPALLEYRPKGPYRLGGHCVGGMVALETARLLAARGHEIEFVAMVDPIWTSVGEPYLILEGATEGPVTLLARSDSSESTQFEISRGHDGVDQKYKEALRRYRPEPVSLPVVAFSSWFDCRQWQQISPAFELFEQVGGHYDWITSRAPEFALNLRAAMSARQ